jgi:hypothetical protein
MSATDPRVRAVDQLLCRWAAGELPTWKQHVVDEVLEDAAGWVRQTVRAWYCQGAERTRELYRERALALFYVLGGLSAAIGRPPSVTGR